MVKLNQLRVDPTLETQGIWKEWEMGVELLIARGGNKAFDGRFKELAEPFLKDLRAKTLPPEKAEELLRIAVSETILLGFRGLENDDETPMEYSHEASLALITDPQLNDLYTFVLVTSNTTSLYRIELDEEGAKN